MTTTFAPTHLFRPVDRATDQGAHASIGAMVLGQAKLAAIVYPTLMAVTFVAAIGAAWLNPSLLDPVAKMEPQRAVPMLTIPPEQSSVPVPTLPRGETETPPLISHYDVEHDRDGRVTVINHDTAPAHVSAFELPAGTIEACIPQVTPTGQLLGRTCTPNRKR